MDNMLTNKTKIGFIGAGKISYSLVPALINSGYNVHTIASTKLSSAKSLALKYKVKHYTNDTNSLVDKCDIIFLSVPDSQIDIAAESIAQNVIVKNKLFIHLSGSKNIGSISALKKKGALTAGFHLLHAFPAKKEFSITGCYASIETENKKALSYLRALSKKAGLNSFIIKKEDKLILHIMCVFAANFLNAEYYNASLLYKKIKTKLPPLEKLLYSLSKSNLENIYADGPLKSLSGPIPRGDYGTVNDHIDMLTGLFKKDKSLENTLDSYSIQTITLLQMTNKLIKKNSLARRKKRKLV